MTKATYSKNQDKFQNDSSKLYFDNLKLSKYNFKKLDNSK